MIKKIFIIILFLSCFFGSKIVVLGADIFYGDYKEIGSSWNNGSCVYSVVALSNCNVADTYCRKGPDSSECGPNYGDCSTTSGGCCENADAWTSNRSMCVKTTGCVKLATYHAGWGKTSSSCYLGDKVNDSDHRLIRAGNCNCGSGGIYKACCSNGTLVDSYVRDVDGRGTLEADCPSGVTTIWAGGANIDLAWADANCNPPCTPDCSNSGNYCAGTTGNPSANGCGTCTGTKPPDCSNSGNYCAGTTGNPSANGCGTCTGTKPLDYTNGACGSANGGTYSTSVLTSVVTKEQLCLNQKLTDENWGKSFKEGGPWIDGPGSIAGTDWKWNCVGTTGTCGTGATANCSATKLINGVCGSANGQTYSNSDWGDYVYNNWGTILCNSVKKFDASNWSKPLWEGGIWTDGPYVNSHDNSQLVDGYPTWNWTCKGEGAGTDASCSAKECPKVLPTYGTCGLSGQTFSTTPTTGLCTYGTASAVTTGKNTYTWTCTGAAGTCPTTSGGVTNCSVVRDTGPTFSTMVVQNADGATVAAEDGFRNQICQTTFTNSSNPNLVRFVVTFTDLQGGGDINYAELGIGNKTYTATTFTVNGNDATTTFEVRRSDFTLPTNVLNIYVRAYDDHSASGVTSIAADTGRDFKFWNCNVPVSGTLFDGSAGTACPSTGFSIPAASTNFQTLVFSNGVGITTPMNIKTANTYGDGNPLVWGKTYTPHFNSDLAMLISSSIKANNSCISRIINLENGSIVDPYADSPTLVADFSGVVDQDSWYQTVGGGLMANSKISNRVPVTCTTNCAMSINGTINTNGIVASQLIDNTGGYPVDSVNKGSPNNWWINKNLAETNSEYSELLNQYFWKAGIGETFTGDKNLSEIGTTGINFVNGNLTVTNDNNVNSGQFLMVIVNGDITVQPEVNNLEGIFVSRNLNIGGSSAIALTIEGMIKTTQNVRVNRTFIDKRTNNTTPAVRFVYRPDFIFSMPAAITKQLTKWQWGN